MAPSTPAAAAAADSATAPPSSVGREFPPWHPITRSRAAAAAVAAAEAAGQPPPPPPPTATYEGTCHCGALAFDVTLSPPLEGGGGGGGGGGADGGAAADDDNGKCPVLSCNCSACRRFGYQLAYPPRANVKWRRGGVDAGPERGVEGGAALGKYRFNSKHVDHLFCRQCGTSIMTDFHQMWAPEFDGFGVNVRTLRGVALDKLALVPWDGMNMVPPVGDLAGLNYKEEDETR